jgi:hypothetical protein
VSLTPPANGTHYVAGETPLVTIVIRNDNGDPIDHTVVTSANFSTAALMVSGPRAHTLPVLTNRALYGNGKLRASASNSVNGPWTFPLGTETFKIAVNGDAPLTLTVPSSGSVTAASIKSWLIAQLAGVTGGVTVTSTATRVTIKSNSQGATSRIDVYDSAVTTIMGWKPTGVTMEPYPVVAQGSYPFNDLRNLNVAGWDGFDYVDPNVTRSTGSITYQLLDVAGLTPGTYSLYLWSRPTAGRVANLSKVGIGFLNFQVGTATAEKKIATNCTSCHADTLMHDPRTDVNGPHAAPFDTDYCKSCHDYGHPNTGDGFAIQGGTSLSGWSGFGAAPISRRVHGVHFGRYLAHPEQIYSGGNPFTEVIFPQDVRNCTKCHSETDDWTTTPSRVACMGCHDSDAEQAHGTLMTSITDPTDPYGPSAIESCGVCHGANAPWAASVVHNVSSPYVPPYVREP